MNRNAKFTIDGTIWDSQFLACKEKEGRKTLVKIMKAHEKYFSRYFDHHLTVTEKMKQFLVDMESGRRANFGGERRAGEQFYD